MDTPRSRQTSLSKVDFSIVPEWDGPTIQRSFLEIRDSRFLIQEGMPEFKRRIPWLYTQNGCFLRAALVRRKVAELGLPGIKKLFIFGQMRFKSHPKIAETITFKDHVAAVLRVGKEILVIDPPICFERTLPLDEWISHLFMNSENKDFQVCLTSEFTLAHNSPVDAKAPADEVGMRSGAMRDVAFFTQDFLKKEYDLVGSLHLSLEETLGERPFWHHS